MYAGCPVETGTCMEIFTEHRHPYTEGLIAAIPHLNAKSDEQLISIPGSPPNLLTPPKGCAFASRCKYAMKICYETAPEKTQCSETHNVFCHLENPMAAGVREAVMSEEGAK
jgi:oligopeptide transport system ATP-binding protein